MTFVLQWLPKFPALFCTPFLVKIAGNLGNLRKKLFWASFLAIFSQKTQILLLFEILRF